MGICCDAWQPEFDPWEEHGKERTTYVPCMWACAHTHTNKVNEVGDYGNIQKL